MVAPGGNYTSLVIFKNGAGAKNGVIGEPTNGPYGVTVSGLIYLNGSTDYIELYGFQARTSGGTLTVISGEALTYFEAFLARAA